MALKRKRVNAPSPNSARWNIRQARVISGADAQCGVALYSGSEFREIEAKLGLASPDEAFRQAVDDAFVALFAIDNGKYNGKEIIRDRERPARRGRKSHDGFVLFVGLLSEALNARVTFNDYRVTYKADGVTEERYRKKNEGPLVVLVEWVLPKLRRFNLYKQIELRLPARDADTGAAVRRALDHSAKNRKPPLSPPMISKSSPEPENQ